MAVIEDMVKDAIEYLVPVVFEMEAEEVGKEKIPFDSVGGFWGADMETGTEVSIEGALSTYAPMLIGPPKLKRELHRAYRRQLPPDDYNRSLPEKEYESVKTTVDAKLAFTAGQMVWRLDLEERVNWVYLGLYHSIVRNAIPVFVDKDYYFNSVQKIFSKGKSPHVVEAEVTGRLQQIPGSLIYEFAEKDKLEHLIRPTLIDAGKRIFGIFVDGNRTKIKYSGAARYLDGDIWIAVDFEGKEFFISRFLDIADPDDLNEESENLKEEVKKFLPKGEIVFQFDQVEPLLPGYQKVSLHELFKFHTQRT